jgi:hypothetical protein
MPLWLLEELEICRAHIYLAVTSDRASCLFDKWGGVIRWVLSLPSSQSEEKDEMELSMTIEQTDVAKVGGQA